MAGSDGAAYVSVGSTGASPLEEVTGAVGAEVGEDKVVEAGAPANVVGAGAEETSLVDVVGHDSPAKVASLLFSIDTKLTARMGECLKLCGDSGENPIQSERRANRIKVPSN